MGGRAFRSDHTADHHQFRRQDGQDGGGAVWLNKEMLSVYDYTQFWRTPRRRCRPLPAPVHRPGLEEIARLEGLQGAELNDAKKVLAIEAAALLLRAARRRTGADSRRAFVALWRISHHSAKPPDGTPTSPWRRWVSNSEARQAHRQQWPQANDGRAMRQGGCIGVNSMGLGVSLGKKKPYL
jgi:hypothetical protein